MIQRSLDRNENEESVGVGLEGACVRAAIKSWSGVGGLVFGRLGFCVGSAWINGVMEERATLVILSHRRSKAKPGESCGGGGKDITC